MKVFFSARNRQIPENKTSFKNLIDKTFVQFYGIKWLFLILLNLSGISIEPCNKTNQCVEVVRL